MREFLRRIRRHWNWTDTIVLGSNTAAFGLFIGNCWWEFLWVTHLALLLPLTIQVLRARLVRDALREALVFGTVVGWSWPVGERFVVRVFGWWGEYVATGIMVLDTPLYTVLVGWLASAYCYYVGRRAIDLGYGPAFSAMSSGMSALCLGIIGENLFIGARMWVYDRSALDLWSVPAFVPVAYGIGYACLPLLWRFTVVVRAVLFNVIMLLLTVGMGLAVGFFPRP